MAIWPLTKMINKRIKKTNHLHFVIISPSLFSQYVLHPAFITIKRITNKRTDKSDRLHFAIVSPSFFFKVLHPEFISIKIKEQTKVSDHSHFAIVSPSFSFSKYFIQCSHLSKQVDVLPSKNQALCVS